MSQSKNTVHGFVSFPTKLKRRSKNTIYGFVSFPIKLMGGVRFCCLPYLTQDRPGVKTICTVWLVSLLNSGARA